MTLYPVFIIDHVLPERRSEVPFTVKWARTETEALEGIHKHMGAPEGTYMVLEEKKP